MSEGKIYFGTDEELYNESSLDDCLDEFSEGAEVNIYKGEAVVKVASDFFYFDSSDLAENAVNNMGENVEGWLTGLTKEQDADLVALMKYTVDAWATKHNLQPTFYGIKNQETLLVKVLADGCYTVLEGEE